MELLRVLHHSLPRAVFQNLSLSEKAEVVGIPLQRKSVFSGTKPATEIPRHFKSGAPVWQMQVTIAQQLTCGIATESTPEKEEGRE